MRGTLTGAGYQPLVTGDPQEADRLMERKRNWLALLDLVRSDTYGIDLMQAILKIADVTVIFFCACGREETISRAS